MKSRNPFILSLAFFIFCAPLWVSATQPGSSDATDIKGFSQTYISCLKAADGRLLDSDACMTSELKYQDARLNKTYKALLGLLKPDSKKALVEAERAWLQSQSKDGDFESTLFGDTQVENAQQLENRLYRLCARANALDKYLALAEL